MLRYTLTLNDLLDAGVHFGHHPKRWNPKMRPYIYGKKADVHIIDLCKTYVMFEKALQVLFDVVSKGGRILFVGTKKQSAQIVAASAQQCGQNYVSTRWLGGTLTNWATVQKSIVRMERLEGLLADQKRASALTKKERIIMERDLLKLEHAFGGLRSMGGLPDMLFVLDAHKDITAVHEARILNIPVMAILDTNADPTFINHIVPGNDDASSAIALYCREAVSAILQGLAAESSTRSAHEEVPTEDAPQAPEAAATASVSVEQDLAKDAHSQDTSEENAQRQSDTQEKGE